VSGLGALLGVLREHGILPMTVISSDPVEVLIAEYRRWLVIERGLAVLRHRSQFEYHGLRQGRS
jgi:hypothetical protein